jgi:hypothetical protein
MRQYEIPERCLLAQAAIYVVRSDVPIPDEIYLASPAQSVGWSDELIWALRAGRLHARGNLFNAMYIKEECRWEQCFLEEEDAEIDSAFWSRDQIDLKMSSLRVNRDAVEAKYEVARFAASFENDDESGPAETCYIFSDITIATKDLFEHSPLSAAPLATKSQLEKTKRGRPPEYNWIGVKQKLTEYVSKYGPIQTLEDLMQKCADFSTDLHLKGKTPDDKTIREAIAAHALDIEAKLTAVK